MIRVWFQETKLDGLQLSDTCAPGHQTLLLYLWANKEAQNTRRHIHKHTHHKHTHAYIRKNKTNTFKRIRGI